MTEELTVSTEEEYYAATQWKLEVSSRKVVLLQMPNAKSMAYLLSILPKEGEEFKDKSDLIGFVDKNFEGISSNIIVPNLVKPRIPASKLYFMDVVDMLDSIMEHIGMAQESGNEGGEGDGFLESKPRNNP